VSRAEHSSDTALWFIGGFKLVKGVLLIAVAIGALHLLHRDAEDIVTTWVTRLHVDPDNQYVDRALSILLLLDDRKLKAISAGTFFYAALLLTEGIGLLLKQRWAEYFTVIVTSSFIPIELYELARHVTATRLIVVGINVAIVGYLVVVLHGGSRETTRQVPPGPDTTDPRGPKGK
jgi:uncharacterized membrane protein (DUF2068 family)